MENKKGLSAIITTVIMIGLVMVAIGIIWFVVQGIIGGGTEDIQYSAKCSGLDIKITSVDCSDGTNCGVIVKRNAGGQESDEIGGVKVAVSDDDGNSEVKEQEEDLAVLATMVVAVPYTKFTEATTTPTKAEVAVFFIKENGDKHICSGVSEFSGVINPPEA